MSMIRAVRGRFAGQGRGFTLIELLIVIAIILILIAIALPNFLEAQIRARVTKAKGEIRTVAIAMDSYFLDFKVYPPQTESDIMKRGRFEQGLMWLTSPIAYIRSLPEDPFPGLNKHTEGGIITFESGGCRAGQTFPRCTQCLVTWVVYSRGPSENPEAVIRGADAHWNRLGGQSIISYNPTNGTKSEGTLHWWGGDPYFIGVRVPTADLITAYKSNPAPLSDPLIVDYKPYLHTMPPSLP